MAKEKTATKTTKTEERKGPNALIILWKKKSKDGKKTFLDSKFFIGFYNTKKENPNQPDLEIYKKHVDGSTGLKYASIWCKTNEKGAKWLSGQLEGNSKEKVYLTGFLKKETESEKSPDVKIYLNSDLKSKEGKEETSKEEPITDDLPF